MNKISKEKRDKLILVGLATAMIAGVWWTFVIGAQKDKLADSNKSIATTRDKVSKAELLNRLGPIIQANLQVAQAALNQKQESMAPASSGSYYWFLKKLDQFKRPFELEILEIKGPNDEDLGLLPHFPYKAAVFAVKMSGRYHEFGKFISEFENTFPYYAVRNIRVTPEVNRTGGPASGTAGAIATSTGSSPNQPGTESLNIEFRVVTLTKPAGS